ncbi:MAG: hypothetical protein KAT34_18035 [Candidatus Aminicenantes bacterium]|nr:hypothetical protein [Candidatus Aminicenantes bacterium]
MSYDPEIIAISKVYESLKDLNLEQKKRIFNWLMDKFNLSDDKEEQKEIPATPQKTSSEKYTAAEEQPPVEEKPTAASLKEFKSLSNLFAVSTAKRNYEKALVAAAYLQETNSLDDFNAREVNTALKKHGHNLSSITVALHTLVNKKPPQLEVTRKVGKSMRYRVTTEGLERAKQFTR